MGMVDMLLLFCYGWGMSHTCFGGVAVLYEDRAVSTRTIILK